MVSGFLLHGKQWLSAAWQTVAFCCMVSGGFPAHGKQWLSDAWQAVAFRCMASGGFPLQGKWWLSAAGCEQFVTVLEDLLSGLFVTLLVSVKRGDLFQVTLMVSVGF